MGERPRLFCVLVCGGRDYAGREHLWRVLDRLDAETPVTRLVHGAATGADNLAAEWAHSKLIPVKAYPADWNRYGRSAGPIRNTKMLVDERPDLVVAFPGGPGTANMVSLARAAGVRVQLVAHG